MKDFEVYLAGRIANLGYDGAIGYRDDFAKKLKKIGIKYRSPIRGKQHLKDCTNITSEAFEDLSIQEVIHRDLSDLHEVDAVVILTGDDPSWGTAGEFYYCTWIARKPTLVIKKNYVGGWMEHYATKIVPDFDAAIEVLNGWKKYWNHKGTGIHDLR